MIDTGWIYVVVDGDRAGSALHTVLVDDIDALLGALAQRGITSGPLETIEDVGVRHAYITDPDGNRLQVGRPPR